MVCSRPHQLLPLALWLLALQGVGWRVQTQLHLEQCLERVGQDHLPEQVALCSWQRAQIQPGLRGRLPLLLLWALMLKQSRVRFVRVAEDGQLAWCTRSSRSACYRSWAPSSEESGN